ncbi:hypothetical protein L211DRAFT_850727 [Terfezia boudieri ATCC MYA-4762]|uniref:Uncharacterized protein n=1 Tax=Terfezia boudieri ATCC MYA-4762 TaxID=1051890 RepID=A0A3N4LHT1_9PEZI|nr:hypothetical protein L211DRAFT_850727 [Terfezia boudieri ATCC MYA-4762]
MAPTAMVPFLAYNRQGSRNHWSGNPTPVQEQAPVGAVGSTRSYTPQYYSEDHRSRDQELEAQFRSELRALRKKYKEDIWTRLWALSRKFREQFDHTFVDEEGALKLSFDKVIRENIRDSFFSLRHDLIEAYKVNKQLVPTELRIECEREEQQLRDKFYDLSNNIKREAKSQFHLEIFDTILILDDKSPPAEQGPLSSIVEEAAVPEQQVEEVAGGSAPQENPDRAQEIKRQENLEGTNLLAEPPATEEPAASVNSKNSSGAASKRSPSSAKSRRSDQGSIHSSVRLQEAPLRIKTPVNLTVTTQGLVSPPKPDPVPVKRNFWGKIIGVSRP